MEMVDEEREMPAIFVKSGAIRSGDLISVMVTPISRLFFLKNLEEPSTKMLLSLGFRAHSSRSNMIPT